jgi:hypothetical protein
MTPEERIEAAFFRWVAEAVSRDDRTAEKGRLVELLADAIREAVEEEREACAKVAESFVPRVAGRVRR